MAKDLTAALQAMTEQAQGQTSRKDKTLPAVKDATAIPDRSGSSGLVKSGEGTGIANPLVETDYAERVFHPEKTLQSTDGILVIKIKPVSQIKFKDAANQPLTIEFKAPPA